MDIHNYYSSDDDGYNEEAIYAANLDEEEARQRDYEEEQRNIRKIQYENELRQAKESSRLEGDYLRLNEIKKFSTLKRALETTQNHTGRTVALFARDIPVKNDNKMRVDYKKQYLLGRLRSFHRYACQVDYKVQLDEVVIADRPCRIHFDIEMKSVDSSLETGERICNVLTLLIEALIPDITVDGEDVEMLKNKYVQVSNEPFTESVCRAGLTIVKSTICGFLSKLDNVEEEHLGMTIVSGCRENKFSLHVVIKSIYCESAVLSMPLVVFEIARSFTVQNIEWLVTHTEAWDSPEGLFRVRALMIDHLGRWVVTEGGENKFAFSGYNDTIFDEAIYSKNHLLRAPGSCKVSNWVGALHPILSEDDFLMRREFCFKSLFDTIGRQQGFWEKHLIQNRNDDDCIHVICGLEPTSAYPSKYKFFSNQSAYLHIVRQGLEMCFDFVHELRNRGGINNVRLLFGNEYIENRYTYRKHRQLTSEERGLVNRDITMQPRQPVHVDECFRTEAGYMQPFRLFNVGDWLFHVHNGVEEQTPSAKVFPGGFHCFGCGETFAVPSASEEDSYEFFEEEIQRSDHPSARLNDFDWERIIMHNHGNKKFHIICAPMGSGKTHQMEYLTNYCWDHQHSVCCVSFRIFLATQQAQRLACVDYQRWNNLMNPPDYLVVVLNSLKRVGPKNYDFVILDECGLIRRHFLSTTVRNILCPVYKRFVDLIRSAGTVVLLQDGKTREDVQFYTDLDGVDCEDRDKVFATQLIKPRVIHPIKYTDNCFAAVHQMVNCYKNGFVVSGDGDVDDVVKSRQPFMVFSSSLVMAEFLVLTLRTAASSIGADPNRIYGIWSSIKEESEFARRFASDPNVCASEADVVICTSVIGAGFSISRHFGSFHAFLTLNILTHTEETQFVQRLRFVMDEMRSDMSRQSYIYVEKGRGRKYEFTDVLETYDVVRKLLYRDVSGESLHGYPLANLEGTHARIVTERANTQAQHIELWEKYSEDFLESEFEAYSIDASQWNWVKEKFIEFKSRRVKNISDLVKITCEISNRASDINYLFQGRKSIS